MTKPAKLLLSFLAILSAAVLLLYAGAWFIARRLVNEQLQQLVASGAYQQAEYSRLWLLPTGTLRLKELHLQQDSFNLVLQDITVSDIDFFHATPWHLSVTASGLFFPDGLPDLAASGNPILLSALQGIANDDTVALELAYSYRYSSSEGEQIAYTSSARLPGFFSLEGEATTRNLPLTVLQEIREAHPDAALALQQQALARASLPSAQLRLGDLGGVEKFIAAMAKTLGTDPTGMRAQLKSQAQNYYLFLPTSLRTLATAAGNELALFLDGGKTLRVSITPAYEGKLAQLQPELMGIIVTGDFDRAAELLQLGISTK